LIFIKYIYIKKREKFQKKAKMGAKVSKVIIKLKEIFPGTTFLGTRVSGEKVREIIEKEIKNGNSIIIDFDLIEEITQSFGDEIIGIFTRAYGKEFVKNNIKAVNYNEEIKVVLNWVVNYSNRYFLENKIAV